MCTCFLALIIFLNQFRKIIENSAPIDCGDLHDAVLVILVQSKNTNLGEFVVKNGIA
jgi:hypothetical protein